jgi:hypothetical protein
MRKTTLLVMSLAAVSALSLSACKKTADAPAASDSSVAAVPVAASDTPVASDASAAGSAAAAATPAAASSATPPGRGDPTRQ